MNLSNEITTAELAARFVSVPSVCKKRVVFVSPDGSYATIHNVTEGGTSQVSRDSLLEIDYVETPHGVLLIPRKLGRPVGTGKPIKAGDDKMNRHTVRMTEREWAYCQEQGDASKFIRGLVADSRGISI